MDCDNAHRPADPFPFFDLPKEVRYMILELLLVRGQVALCPDREIRERIPEWIQQRPEWAVLAVNRQMSAEAADILFSSRNTFFIPFGGVQFVASWPPIRKLDCAFSIRDFPQGFSTSLSDFSNERFAYDRHHGQGSFERLPRGTKLEILHERKLVWLRSIWGSLAEAIMSFHVGLELLRIDLRNCRCPIGCCWLGLDVLTLLEGFGDESSAPRRIEIFNVPEQEEPAMTDILWMRYESVSFVKHENALSNAIAEELITEAPNETSDSSSAPF